MAQKAEGLLSQRLKRVERLRRLRTSPELAIPRQIHPRLLVEMGIPQMLRMAVKLQLVERRLRRPVRAAKLELVATSDLAARPVLVAIAVVPLAEQRTRLAAQVQPVELLPLVALQPAVRLRPVELLPLAELQPEVLQQVESLDTVALLVLAVDQRKILLPNVFPWIQNSTSFTFSSHLAAWAVRKPYASSWYRT